MFIAQSASLAGTSVTTLASSTFNAGFERLMIAQASNHQAEFVAVMRQLAGGTVSTRKIDALESYADGTSNIAFAMVDQGGVANSSSKVITGNSIVLPVSVSWSAGSPAVLSCGIQFLSSNGTTAPVTVSSSGGSTGAEQDVWVGYGTGITSINVNFGFNLSVPPDGHLYPINAFISSQRPSIAVTYLDESYLTTANVMPGSISTLTAIFSKIASGGVRGSTLSFAVTGHYHVGSAMGGKPGSVTVTCAGTGGLTIS